MITVIGRYLSGRFLTAFLFALAALVALALTLDLMEQADRVLASDRGGILGLLRYSALRLPDLISQMLQISTLLAMLLALGQFLRHSEMVALWSSGVAPSGLMLAVLPVVAVLGAFNFVNNDMAVPQTRLELREWGFGENQKSGFLAENGEKSAWLLSGTDIVRAPRHVDPDGTLRNVTIFRRDADSRLIERIDAKSALALTGDTWLLSGVTVHRVEPATIVQAETLRWNGHIDLDALPLIASDGRELSSSELLDLIEHEGYGQRPPNRFRTWLYERIASPFLPALMAFLVVALIQRFRRTGAFGALLLSSLGIGFAYFVLDGICLALGEAGMLPPWFAAWSPKLALACLIGSFLVGRES